METHAHITGICAVGNRNICRAKEYSRARLCRGSEPRPSRANAYPMYQYLISHHILFWSVYLWLRSHEAVNTSRCGIAKYPNTLRGLPVTTYHIYALVYALVDMQQPEVYQYTCCAFEAVSTSKRACLCSSITTASSTEHRASTARERSSKKCSLAASRVCTFFWALNIIYWAELTRILEDNKRY